MLISPLATDYVKPPKPKPRKASVKKAAAKKPAKETNSRGTRGLYTLKNAEKYIGNAANVVWRSRWELRMMQFLDLNPNIISWASEEIKIGYYHPIKKRRATYIPDFFVKYKNKDGMILNEIIEIKPQKETHQTAKSSMYDKVMIAINMAKWAAANEYCLTAGMKFRVLTEKELFA